jgi:hypothetical protein
MQNFINALTPRYPEDIPVIRKALMETGLEHVSTFGGGLTSTEIERLWIAFSVTLGGSYLNVNDRTLEQFKEWVLE